MAPQRIYRALEGGGVRGIAHIGAAAVFDLLDNHYATVANVGTSAGADAAAILSAGLDAATAKRATLDFPFAKVLGGIDGVPLVGKFIEGGNLVRAGGLHDGSHLENAIAGTLKTYAHISSYGDLNRMIASGHPRAAKLFITAHDVSHGQVVFPDAYASVYGITDPNQQSIAFSGRASSSIPGFFTPAPIRDAQGTTYYLADGGVDAILPYDVATQLAAEHDPGARVINFALGEEPPPAHLDGDSPMFGVQYLYQLLRSISGGRRDELMRDPEVRKSTVMIETTGISSTQFDLTPDQQSYLYNSGVVSAMEFVVRDLTTTLTSADRSRLAGLAQTSRRELMQLSGDVVANRGGVTVAMLAPLQRRLDTVSRQVAAAEVATLG